MTKLDRKILMKQNVLRKLPTVSLRLIPFLASKTDIDGRINVTITEIENAGIMSKRMVKDALYHLENEKWIYRGEDNFYYSKFNVVSEESRKDYYYINLYKFFADKNFMKLYKRQLIFLYYILSSKMPGNEHSIAIEYLYKNQTNSENVKLPFFINFEDMVKNLVKLIELGFFEVRLGNENFFIDKDTENIKEKIYAFAGKNSNKRKKRMSLKEENNKIIHIRISKELVSKDQVMDVYDASRLSTMLDLSATAKKYGCSIVHYGKDIFEKIHALKEGIFKEIGSTGIKIYREAIIDFFDNRSYSFEKLMKNGEFPNTLKNYYVIPRIQQKIKSFFEQVQEVCVKKIEEFPYEEFDQKLAANIIEKSEPYISYFKNNAYLDDIILLDNQLKKADSILYNEVSKLNRNWYLLREEVEKIYQYEKKVCGNDREQVVYLAEQGLLTNKKRQNEDIKIYKQRHEYRPEYKDIFYNWLDS